MKTIYDLELHEELEFNNFKVMRVASGWLYDTKHLSGIGYMNNWVFVPFDNKFQIV